MGFSDQARASNQAGSQGGWLLTGSQSTRVGRDKAGLPWSSRTMIEVIAEAVRQAAGNVALVGSPERYQSINFQVVADADGGYGPLSGLFTVLNTTKYDWNLVVASDMPRLTAPFLKDLLDRAKAEGKACLIPQTSQGLEPLCAVYHRRLLPSVDYAVHHNVLKMQDFVKTLDPFIWPVPQGVFLENWNTTQDLAIK
jgi:molybdopterin-guanine dinucleotide biosynthesis protein A